MTADAILNYNKSGILGYSNTYMVSVSLHTKFEANTFVSNQDMAKKINLIQHSGSCHRAYFSENGILGHSNPLMVLIYQHS